MYGTKRQEDSAFYNENEGNLKVYSQQLLPAFRENLTHFYFVWYLCFLFCVHVKLSS